MITVMTMTYADEAVGVALAARDLAMPAAISFTVATDGRLPSGQPLAHPTHFEDVLDGPWCERIGALRANASRRSHAEIDDADELDDGHPEDLARR
jgi:S-methylmethionine-dependent homocysteine/selenocysteine methylase